MPNPLKPAIVVIAFNRPDSLKRLLRSLGNAVYHDDSIPLVLSIDHLETSANEEVVRIAEEFDWKHGTKKIVRHQNNLGLREHILKSGDLTQLYGSIILLEDDLVVSPYFYTYAAKAVRSYQDEDMIAGISLYSYEWCHVAKRAFVPAQNGSDVYFLQNAQSWGQAWTHKMWTGFKQWYLEKKELKVIDNKKVPEIVANWSDKSWLKYHIWYCIDKNKYFVYPYVSLSTNHGEPGQHVKNYNSAYQVALLAGEKNNYDMPPFTLNSCRYDAFFERQDLHRYLDFPMAEADLCVDIYGSKDNKEGKKYWLTSRVLNFKILKSFSLQMRPHELNIVFDVPGEDIFLYDATWPVPKKKSWSNKLIESRIAMYDIRGMSYKQYLKAIKFKILSLLSLNK